MKNFQWGVLPMKISRGTVKWYNEQKGYGFVVPEGGGKDVFLHVSALQKSGLDGIEDGTPVTFVEKIHKGKTVAEDIEVVGKPAATVTKRSRY
jgi:cold shock protein